MERHYPLLLLRFAWIYPLFCVLAGLLSIQIGNGLAGVAPAPLLAAALDGGARFYNRTGRQPGNREAWVFAAAYALLAQLFVIALLLLAIVIDPEIAAALPGLVPAMIVLVVGAFSVVFCRLFASIGARIAEQAATEGSA